MKVSTFAKAGVSVSAAAALTLGLCANSYAAGPTATDEDNSFTSPVAASALVGVGSDTTQDVMYGVAKAINAAAGKQTVVSYTATGTGTLTYRSGKQPNPRPNGSGPGYAALKDSIGLTAAGVAGVGDVDFSRASGTQGTAATTPGAGVTTDIPFAVDTMSVAVPAGSPFLLTNGGNGLTITDLYKIYAGDYHYVAADGTLLTDAATGALPINAFLPKAGSGSRQFFLQQLATQGSGITLGSNKGDSYGSTSTPTAGAPYIGSKATTGVDVQEHDATALTTAPATVAAIAPFSGAKFIGYHNGTIADPDAGHVAGSDYRLVPLRSTVTGAPATGVLPYTGDATTTAKLSPNSAYKTFATKGTEGQSFKLFRDVYNIIPTAAVKGHGTSSNAKYNLLYKTFVGADSDVCKLPAAVAAIADFGFLPASNCGDTSLTFDTPSTATPTVTVKTAGVAGKSVVLAVSVKSNGNQGGTATISVNGQDYTGTVNPGTTVNGVTQDASGTVTIPTPAAGTFSYTGSFIPSLAGVAAAPIAAGTFTVAKAPAPIVKVVKVNATIKAVAPKVSHTKKGKVAVTVTAPRTVATGTVTVVIKKGTKTALKVKPKALVNGKVVVKLTKKLKKGKYKVFVSYSGSAKVNPVASRPVTVLKVR
jgi:hypothetical protein